MEHGRRGTEHVLSAKVSVPPVRGMVRERLQVLAHRLWDQPLALVVAPAGAGKTTLLSHLAAAVAVPSAWYRAEGSERSEPAFVAHIQRALAGAVPHLADREPCADVDELIALVEGAGDGRVLLVVDDLHELEGSDSERAFARLVEMSPPQLALLGASRAQPDLNMSRLRLHDAVLEVHADDLRFRAWEVEELFHEFYAEPLPPEDLATLTRRTEGWAAGLQLFHLATRGKPASERRRTLASLGPRSRTVREYLVRNVLEGLSGEVRRFLVETSVLDRLTGPLCDALLGTDDAAPVLAHLEQHQIFTYRLDDAGSYRYHEVLRSHLAAILVDTVGEQEARERSRRAGDLLADHGYVTEALSAYARGEDWQGVARLLGREGEQLATPGHWIELVPHAIRRHDPWILLATARQRRAGGDWAAALDAYREAAALFGPTAPGDLCREERQTLVAWLDADAVRPRSWAGVVRTAVFAGPSALDADELRLLDTAPAPNRAVARGAVALVAGRLVDAVGSFREVLDDADASPTLVAAAQAGAGVAALLRGEPDGALGLGRATEDAERLGQRWLADLGRTCRTLAGQADLRRSGAHEPSDAWGRPLCLLVTGLGGVLTGAPREEPLVAAQQLFDELGAAALAAWAEAGAALAAAHDGAAGAATRAGRAERRARTLGVPGAQLLALHALASTGPPAGAEAAIERLEGETDLRLPHALRRSTTACRVEEVDQPVPVVTVRLLGCFELEIAGRPVDLGSLRPRARAVLQLLALHADRPVHRDRLLAALWPDTDSAAGARSLQTSVSSLRQLLEPAGNRRSHTLLVRDGEAYRLALGERFDHDAVALGAGVDAGRRAAASGDRAGAIAAYRDALGRYRGELLPEAGPAEWVVDEREHCRQVASEAAEALAWLELDAGDAKAAAATAERGLQIDRYRDGIWRALVEALERIGDLAAAARARKAYDEVLADLGVG